jgi:predicted Zn-dependent protease
MNLVTLAGMVAGVFLGASGGSADAAQAMTIGSAAATQTLSLAYSREDESQADQLGLQYIIRAGYDPHGLLTTLRKIRSKQWFGSEQVPTYMMTHPAVEARITAIDAWIAVNPAQHTSKRSTMAATNREFKIITTRLKALYGDTESILQEFQQGLQKKPDDADLAYGYGLVLARAGKRTESVAYLKKALAKNMLDTDILVDLGRVYFQDGRYQEALDTLRGALSKTLTTNSEGLFYLGRTQLALEQFNQAALSFESLIHAHKDFQQAYYYLGETYGKLNKMPDAHYYLGLFYFKKKEFQTARFHLQRARNTLDDPIKLKTIDAYLKSIG